tara:strand:+ start:4601 stop:5221 length:621 start_codon:yes stop_codon:yes gene_type:complete
MKKTICIIDYGCGNTKSILNSLKYINSKAVISNKDDVIKKSSHLILPGVGSYGNAMLKINSKINLKLLNNEVLNVRKPILGICVGMQIMSNYGFEFKRTKGLSWLDGEVKKMRSKPNIIPQIGWNNLDIKIEKNKIFENITKKDFFYFVHSFQFNLKKKNDLLASTFYNDHFSSVINRKNILGVQFHPEKSQSAGIKFLKNFIDYF